MQHTASDIDTMITYIVLHGLRFVNRDFAYLTNLYTRKLPLAFGVEDVASNINLPLLVKLLYKIVDFFAKYGKIVVVNNGDM